MAAKTPMRTRANIASKVATPAANRALPMAIVEHDASSKAAELEAEPSTAGDDEAVFDGADATQSDEDIAQVCGDLEEQVCSLYTYRTT